MTYDAPKRPLLRYFGGKWRIAPWILSHLSPHRVYVEPYGGGASILLRKPRSYGEIYNDLDGEIVNLFRVVRDHGKELSRVVLLTPFAREEFAGSYEPSEDPIEQARRTLVRSSMGFGADGMTGIWHTGFRSNCKRRGTTPAKDWTGIPKVISDVCCRLAGVVIENRDATEVMAANDSPETLHYCDPPYPWGVRAKRERSTRPHGYRCEMTDDEHLVMLDFLDGLKGDVVLSGYDCPMYAERLAGWARFERSALADGARERTEVLWCKRKSNGTLL